MKTKERWPIVHEHQLGTGGSCECEVEALAQAAKDPQMFEGRPRERLFTEGFSTAYLKDTRRCSTTELDPSPPQAAFEFPYRRSKNFYLVRNNGSLPRTPERLLHRGMTPLSWRDTGKVANFEHHQFSVLFERVAHGLQDKPCVDLSRTRVGVIERSADEGKAVALGGEPATQGPPQVMNSHAVTPARLRMRCRTLAGSFRCQLAAAPGKT
jgi:hypothetical protein